MRRGFCYANFPSLGDASAHSLVLRSSSSRPGPPVGCSRCERRLDTVAVYAASSTVVRPTCAPLPLWPPLSASDDSDADTLCETGDRSAQRLVRLPPAACVACDCLAW